MLDNLKIDPLVIAIIISVGLAYFFPQLGASTSAVPLNTITEIGVGLIFFFYGLGLSNDALKNGLTHWKLHLSVQSSTFILYPLIVLLFYPFIQETSYEIIWLSFFFMASLPSTVSSSVILVSMAKGNLSAAIFNASISGLLGILLTPLWLSPFIQNTTGSIDFSTIYIKLISEIVIPLILGLFLRRFLGKYARQYNTSLKYYNKFIILLIIYKSFVHSFEDQIFNKLGLGEMTLIVCLVLILFFSVFYLTGWIAKKLQFKREDQIVTQYCGSKKSLVHGAVYSDALFGQASISGLILLPLMFHHAFQLLIVSTFAHKEAKSKEKQNNA